MLAMSDTEAAQEFFSTGKLYALTQLSVPTLQRVLADRGVSPSFHIDNVPYYDGLALLELRAFLREQDT